MANPFDDIPMRSPGVLEPAANPFEPGAGAVPPVLGGRRAQVQMLGILLQRLQAQRHHAPELLEGPRGVGKTSLLASMGIAARARGIVTVELEVRGDVRETSIGALVHAVEQLSPRRRLADLAGRLTALKVGPAALHVAPQPTQDLTAAALVVDLGTVAHEVGLGVLITIDEAHEDLAAAATIVQGLHRTGQHGDPMTAVIAGLPGTAAGVARLVSYAERLRVTEVGLLDADGVAEALQGPFADHDIAIDDDVVDAVARQSGGYPYFVQIWGAELWNGTTDPRRVDTKALSTAAIEVAAHTDRFHRRRWDGLTARQQDYVAALSRRGGSARTAEVADDLGSAQQDLGYLREGLLRSGVVYAPARGIITLTVPPMADWVVAEEDGRPAAAPPAGPKSG